MSQPIKKPVMGYPTTKKPTDRLPPHSPEAEQGVLGSIILSADDCLSECQGKLADGWKVFYELRHQNLYRTLVDMRKEGAPIDSITVHSRLKSLGALDEVGGLSYVAGLADAVPSAANLDYYIQIVLEKYALRRLVQACTDIAGRAMDCDGSVAGILGEAEADILQICRDSRVERRQQTKAEIAQDAIADWEWPQQHPGELSGIGTGLADLDRLLAGWQPCTLSLIGARPSVGKSAILVGFARHAAINLNVPTLFFSAESSAKEILKRLACQMTGANQQNLRNGTATEADMNNLPKAFSQIAKAPIFIEWCAGASIRWVQERARQMVEEHGIKLVLADYLQKLKPSDRHEKRTYEVAQVSEGLKIIAEERGVPVVSAAQLNREPDKHNGKQKGRMPVLSDLADSAQIERDADNIGLLHRRITEQGAVEHMLIFAKVRDGPLDTIKLHFTAHCARFDNASKVSNEDMPARRAPYPDA